MGQLKQQGEREIMLFITAELACICINRSRLGYKDIPQRKNQGKSELSPLIYPHLPHLLMR